MRIIDTYIRDGVELHLTKDNTSDFYDTIDINNRKNRRIYVRDDTEAIKTFNMYKDGDIQDLIVEKKFFEFQKENYALLYSPWDDEQGRYDLFDYILYSHENVERYFTPGDLEAIFGECTEGDVAVVNIGGIISFYRFFDEWLVERVAPYKIYVTPVEEC